MYVLAIYVRKSTVSFLYISNPLEVSLYSLSVHVGFIRLGYAEVQRAIMGFQLCEASADVEKSDILIRPYLSPHSLDL